MSKINEASLCQIYAQEALIVLDNAQEALIVLDNAQALAFYFMVQTTIEACEKKSFALSQTFVYLKRLARLLLAADMYNENA
jgi:hypothetical protein